MSITMREVAQHAGVSKATVSYVLNGQEAKMRIPEETRSRILRSVAELGYHPNAVARNLAHKRTDTIAVVMQFPALFSGWSGFTNFLMHGVTDACVQEGLDVLLHTRQPLDRMTGSNTTQLEAEVRNLTDGRVDGALLLRDVDDPLAAELHKKQFPAVLMFTHSRNPEQWFVDCENELGARMATEHLIKLGHKRIIHLAGPIVSGSGRERSNGYRNAMRGAGLEIKPEWEKLLPSTGSDFGETLDLFRAPASERPTAVFAWSDDVAMQMMQNLRSIGLRIPDDVALIGFDSTPLCDHTDPPLSSVRQPIYEMSCLALTLLKQKIGGTSPKETQIRVAPELTIRKSCGTNSTVFRGVDLNEKRD